MGVGTRAKRNDDARFGALVFGPLLPPATPRGRAALVVELPADELPCDGDELLLRELLAAGVGPGELRRGDVFLARCPIGGDQRVSRLGGAPATTRTVLSLSNPPLREWSGVEWITRA